MSSIINSRARVRVPAAPRVPSTGGRSLAPSSTTRGRSLAPSSTTRGRSLAPSSTTRGRRSSPPAPTTRGRRSSPPAPLTGGRRGRSVSLGAQTPQSQTVLLNSRRVIRDVSSSRSKSAVGGLASTALPTLGSFFTDSSYSPRFLQGLGSKLKTRRTVSSLAAVSGFKKYDTLLKLLFSKTADNPFTLVESPVKNHTDLDTITPAIVSSAGHVWLVLGADHGHVKHPEDDSEQQTRDTRVIVFDCFTSNKNCRIGSFTIDDFSEITDNDSMIRGEDKKPTGSDFYKYRTDQKNEDSELRPLTPERAYKALLSRGEPEPFGLEQRELFPGGGTGQDTWWTPLFKAENETDRDKLRLYLYIIVSKLIENNSFKYELGRGTLRDAVSLVGASCVAGPQTTRDVCFRNLLNKDETLTPLEEYKILHSLEVLGNGLFSTEKTTYNIVCSSSVAYIFSLGLSLVNPSYVRDYIPIDYKFCTPVDMALLGAVSGKWGFVHASLNHRSNYSYDAGDIFVKDNFSPVKYFNKSIPYVDRPFYTNAMLPAFQSFQGFKKTVYQLSNIDSQEFSDFLTQEQLEFVNKINEYSTYTVPETNDPWIGTDIVPNTFEKVRELNAFLTRYTRWMTPNITDLLLEPLNKLSNYKKSLDFEDEEEEEMVMRA
jgi:hypothetical protein